jgi:hypothetical protein
MNELEFFWLAGLLEGEGSFFKGPPSDPNGARIQIMMTDEDVIARVSKIFGMSYLATRLDREHMKPIYMTVLKVHKGVELMKQLRPLMGRRRQAQIDKAVASYTFSEQFGSNHPNAKLHEDDIRVIRNRLAAGETLTALAKEFGVDKGLVWQIKEGRRWKHVT